ncbi:MAG: hypothetical protein IAE79_11435 [Anaerolinea sp.]|nr:hypothetical protein [Anaerolinea sp.]
MSEATPPKSEALKQLEEQAALLAQQQAIAESEKAIAEAKKGKLAAELPTGAAAPPPEGSITADTKFGYLAELVAYDTLARQAGRLAEQLEQTELPANSKLLLVTDPDVTAGDVQLLQVRQQLDALATALQGQIESNEAQMETLLKALALQREALESLPPKGGLEPAGLAPGVAALTPTLTAATAIIGAAAGIANMFRVDYDIKGQEITLSATALHALVAGKVTRWPVYLPHFARVSESPLLAEWSDLVKQRWTLQNQLQRLLQEILEPLRQQIATRKTEIANLPDAAKVIKQAEITRLEQAQAAAQTAIQQSESLIAAHDESSKALLSVPEGQAASPLATAILRERLNALSITHLLYVTIVSSGGEAITSKRWFTSGHTAFLGGSVVSYLLADLDGRVVVADTLVEAGRLEYALGSKAVPAFQGSRAAASANTEKKSP